MNFFSKISFALRDILARSSGRSIRVSEALGAMDVQVNASTISETSSLSLLEGMSIGLPAIASDCGGNPSLIFPGENGFLFENRRVLRQ